jgi:hypothetical protein
MTTGEKPPPGESIRRSEYYSDPDRTRWMVASLPFRLVQPSLPQSLELGAGAVGLGESRRTVLLRGSQQWNGVLTLLF